VILEKISEKVDFEFNEENKNIMKNLIENISRTKRQRKKENNDETPEVKLGRRLKQRSYQKLSEEILEHLIIRYIMDHNRLPLKENLIEMMVNFLGNIQKTPDYYNLKNKRNEINFKRDIDKKIGSGLNGRVYTFKLDSTQTKKNSKNIAYKFLKDKDSYNFDIHVSSAILLALYGFQPKYYNKYFMEIGDYEGKSQQRRFLNLMPDGRNVVGRLVNMEGTNIIEKNIKWYILYNFANIKDQTHNSMIRDIDKELIKIDIRCLNSERKHTSIQLYLNCFYKHSDIFIKNKNEIMKELDKLLIINEEFLLDLIIFRTQRGCFEIENEDLANQIDCLSSSYKVIKIAKYNDLSFEKLVNRLKDKEFINNHFNINPALSSMFSIFLEIKIFDEKEYNEYIDKFNNKSKKFEQIANDIREGKYLIKNIDKEIKSEIKEEEDDDKDKEKEMEEEEVKEEKIKEEEIKEENIKIKEEKIKEEIKEEIKEGVKEEEIKEERKNIKDIIEEEIKEEIKDEGSEENINEKIEIEEVIENDNKKDKLNKEYIEKENNKVIENQIVMETKDKNDNDNLKENKIDKEKKKRKGKESKKKKKLGDKSLKIMFKKINNHEKKHQQNSKVKFNKINDELISKSKPYIKKHIKITSSSPNFKKEIQLNSINTNNTINKDLLYKFNKDNFDKGKLPSNFIFPKLKFNNKGSESSRNNINYTNINENYNNFSIKVNDKNKKSLKLDLIYSFNKE